MEEKKSAAKQSGGCMLTVLLISALVMLLVILGRESDRSRSQKVVEIIDYSEAEFSGGGAPRRSSHQPNR
jgi:hypothetical protein